MSLLWFAYGFFKREYTNTSSKTDGNTLSIRDEFTMTQIQAHVTSWEILTNLEGHESNIQVFGFIALRTLSTLQRITGSDSSKKLGQDHGSVNSATTAHFKSNLERLTAA